MHNYVDIYAQHLSKNSISFANAAISQNVVCLSSAGIFSILNAYSSLTSTFWQFWLKRRCTMKMHDENFSKPLLMAFLVENGYVRSSYFIKVFKLVWHLCLLARNFLSWQEYRYASLFGLHNSVVIHLVVPQSTFLKTINISFGLFDRLATIHLSLDCLDGSLCSVGFNFEVLRIKLFKSLGCVKRTSILWTLKTLKISQKGLENHRVNHSVSKRFHSLKHIGDC